MVDRQTDKFMQTGIFHQLQGYADAEKAIILSRFFKTGKGEYGEGDRFLGIAVPHIRLVARQFVHAPLDVVARLLDSEWHECRMCALLILVLKCRKASQVQRAVLCEFYLSHTGRINNWDLVDLSAPVVVGEFLLSCPDRLVLYRLAESPWLWERRIAMVSTLTFIRHGEFRDAFLLADRLADSRHDLMQKAVGWMLREMGKRSPDLLRVFLGRHASTMPRTMLRYAIEKLDETERKAWMSRKGLPLSPLDVEKWDETIRKFASL